MVAETQTPRRVVVTGIGMVTAVGIGREENWRALLAGENGIRPVTLCDPTDLESRIAGEVVDFDPLNYVDRKEARPTGDLPIVVTRCHAGGGEVRSKRADIVDLEAGVTSGLGVHGYSRRLAE